MAMSGIKVYPISVFFFSLLTLIPVNMTTSWMAQWNLKVKR